MAAVYRGAGRSELWSGSSEHIEQFHLICSPRQYTARSEQVQQLLLKTYMQDLC
jgi:hypothetical protein